MKEAVRVAWHHLERAGFDRDIGFNIQRMTWDAEAAEREAEKGHRRMGRRVVPGRRTYALGVEETARLFVLQHAYEVAKGAGPRAPKSFDDAAGFTPRCLIAYAIGERIRKAGKVAECFPDTRFAAIDYATDVAR